MRVLVALHSVPSKLSIEEEVVVKLWLFNTAIIMSFLLIISAKAKAILAYHVFVSSKRPVVIHAHHQCLRNNPVKK